MRLAFTLFAFLIISTSLKAQYTYIDANFGYHNLRFKRVNDDSFENIALNELRFNLSATYRATKRFGFGICVGLPLISGFNSNYNNAPTSNNNSVYFGESGDDFSSLGSFAPTEFAHDLQNPMTISIYPRLYLGEESAAYIDLRYNFMRLSEQFTFIRPSGNPSTGPPIGETNIRYDESMTARGFGLKLAVESHFADHWTFTYGLILDYYNFDNLDGFEYNIEYSASNASYDYLVLGSAIRGKDISWQFGYGIAYVF
jgi:hypothetical protein